MRLLRNRPLTTPVKLTVAALVLGAGALGLTTSAAHAAPGDPAAAPSRSEPSHLPASVQTKAYSMFTCTSARCTAQGYGDNFSSHTYFISNEESHTLTPACKGLHSGPAYYVGTVDSWTGSWRVSSKDFSAPFDDTGLPDC
jgi:hypothetical protein